MINDNADETILIQQSMSERLSELEAKRLFLTRRHLQNQPLLDLKTTIHRPKRVLKYKTWLVTDE